MFGFTAHGPSPLDACIRGIAFVAAISLVGCDSNEFRDDALRTDAGAVVVLEPDPVASVTPRCRPAVSSEPLPARLVAMQGGTGGQGTKGVTVGDLFATFAKSGMCGNCHTNGANFGGYDVSKATFSDKITDAVLARIRSEDPALIMPKPSDSHPNRFSLRASDDPVVLFAAQLEQWLAEGKPNTIYPASADQSGGAGEGFYILARDVGGSMTNLGNCVPEGNYAVDDTAAARAAELDEKFAAMSSFADLPKTLSETDLISFDSEELAKYGIYAFAPAYTLWADNAKKIRYIRVPQGTSVAFDAEAQTFALPPNTRFYKTFFKRVVDIHGNSRYRKIETRLILARPDGDGEVLSATDYVPAALFGTYEWNDDESEAVLVERPYRDGEGFADTIKRIVVDEQREDQVLRESGDDEEKLLEVGAAHHYAIPGSDRCTHCHMGAPDKSFILGFTPLQINRRPLGEGGVIEPAEAHELDQLERLIGYGVITGLTSAKQVVPLEDSQPGRAPRNAHELAAQGYMLGNCAHCHNPRGFPSLREKSLQDVLNFEPGLVGGIFEFPLDTFSPRSFRGADQDIKIPYITPSLFDHPVAAKANVGVGGSVSTQGLKWIADLTRSEAEPIADALPHLRDIGLVAGRPLLAPWRSLIYRNVDGPFSYEDSGAIFPHMPMDTPGYDCRARRVLGSWMTSIPARRESTLESDLGEMSDDLDQPYVEVALDDPEYARYVEEAIARLARFQNSERYDDCPDPNMDILAPEVVAGTFIVPRAQETTILDADGNPSERYQLLSAPRPHYPDTDLRDDRSWNIRRDDWETVLVKTGVDPGRIQAEAKKASDLAIGITRSLTLSEGLKDVLLEERPFGLWLNKPECAAKLAPQKKVSSFADAQPDWMTITKPEPDAPVYMSSDGAQVFGTVCSKCHGPDATGNSALASTIADLTGAKARVANLRDGLFGPLGGAGSNAQRMFSVAEGKYDGSAQDWAARYLVWMGLGGTNAAIPRTVLTQIGSARSLGQSRKGSLGTLDAASAANMLGLVRAACSRFLPASAPTIFDPPRGRLRQSAKQTVDETKGLTGFTLEDLALIANNGDAQLWEHLCQLDNPQPIKVLVVEVNSRELDKGRLNARPDLAPSSEADAPPGPRFNYIYRRTSYPAEAPIGDQNGNVVAGLTDENLAPWCVTTQSEDQVTALGHLERRYNMQLPRCPNEFLGAGTGTGTGTQGAKNHLMVDEADAWAARGAANAGLAVYFYLEALAKGELKPVPTYDKCEDL